MAHSIEPNSTADISPVTANDDNLDEVEDDDPFSKRRYVNLLFVNRGIIFLFCGFVCLLRILANNEQEDGWWD